MFRSLARLMMFSRKAILGSALMAMPWGVPLPASPGQAESAAPNRVEIRMRTPHGGFNRLVVQVTVCVPGTNRCATIDDVMIDTGSTGLRLEAAAVPSWLRLPAFDGLDRKPLAACVRFVADDAWGAILRADVRIGGLQAPDLPIQVIDDGSQPQPPSCPRSDVRPTSNGTLGIGPDLTDCRGACVQGSHFPTVYRCDAAGCMPVEGPVAPQDRLPNPVSRFPEHNNGIVIDFPPAPPSGAGEMSGSLTFGVGTADNNQLGNAGIVRLDANGHFTTLYEGLRYPESYIDSGTETNIVPDDRLPQCADIPTAFCVSPPLQLDAVMVGRDGSNVPARFRVGDYEDVLAHRYGASDGVAVAAAPSSKAFVWGAPFFLGKRVFVVMDGRSVPTAPDITGPLYGVLDRSGSDPPVSMPSSGRGAPSGH